MNKRLFRFDDFHERECGLSRVLVGRVVVALFLILILETTSYAAETAAQPLPTEVSPSTNSNESNKANRAVSDIVAGEMEVAAFGNALTNKMRDVAQKVGAAESAAHNHSAVFVVFMVLMLALVAVVRFGRKLTSTSIKLKTEAPAKPDRRTEPKQAGSNPEEEQAFADFAASFRIGPKGLNRGKVQPEPAKPEEPAHRAPAEFIRWAPNRIARCRFLLQEMGKIKEHSGQKKRIVDLQEQIQGLKADAAHPDLTPFWQVTSAMGGLLKQMADKPSNVNPSTLRTVAGSIDLLDRLCSTGLDPDLLKNPPVRFLAVDDDSISRHTVSFALKQALTAPDLAENADRGMDLAEKNHYDAIFLDVQMPGVNGFELCKLIRLTELNRSTPIVFVTCQSDFNSRAQSSLAGGCDLIGKPFLTFEIAAKALILSIGSRLKQTAQAESQTEERELAEA